MFSGILVIRVVKSEEPEGIQPTKNLLEKKNPVS